LQHLHIDCLLCLLLFFPNYYMLSILIALVSFASTIPTSPPPLWLIWFLMTLLLNPNYHFLTNHCIAWNIFVVLLLPNTSSTSSSTYLGVKFCGVSYLKAFFDDIPLSFICKPRSISNPYPFANLGPLCGNTTVSGPKLLNVGFNTTICGSWDGCGYHCSIYGCVTCTSIGASSWTSICAWKSYKSFTIS
jgi:hypothetical protein